MEFLEHKTKIWISPDNYKYFDISARLNVRSDVKSSTRKNLN